MDGRAPAPPGQGEHFAGTSAWRSIFHTPHRIGTLAFRHQAIIIFRSKFIVLPCVGGVLVIGRFQGGADPLLPSTLAPPRHPAIG